MFFLLMRPIFRLCWMWGHLRNFLSQTRMTVAHNPSILPSLEVLEARVVPTIVVNVWKATAQNNLWNNPNNWNLKHVPRANETVELQVSNNSVVLNGNETIFGLDIGTG
jgi:hypothetical protein